MSDASRVPRGTEWADVLEVLHAVANTVTVRSHYAEGHPAIAHADEIAAQGFARVLERVPDLVVALIDGEFVVCERPLPELRDRLHVLADAMMKHDIECFVFQKGVTKQECTVLGAALARAAEMPGRVREQAQASLLHVLLRYAGLAGGEGARGAEGAAPFFVPAALEVLVGAARALAGDAPIDKPAVTALATQIVGACSSRAFALEQRSWTRSIDDEAAHAANVATMTAVMAIDAGYPQRTCIDVTAAALLHDVGHLFLPEEIRGIPEPLLDARARAVFRNHTYAGASMLLGAGCSPLWIAVALEHHRGVDGKGYPELGSNAPPHELVRIVALANFMDRKRILLDGRASDPDDALRAAIELEPRYFGRPLVTRFLRTLGVFPPGTTVELSNGENAVVTRASGADPWRPQVRFLHGPDAGRHAELRDMNAAEARHALSIVRPIAPPLLVLSDAAVTAPARSSIDDAREHGGAQAIRSSSRPPDTSPRPEHATPSAADAARAELGGMAAMLDSLLSIPATALVSSPPQAPSSPAPARVEITMPPAPARPPPGASAPPRAEPPRRIDPRVDPVAPLAATRPSSAPRPPPPAPPAPPPAARSQALPMRSVAKVIAPDLARVGLDHRGGFLLTFIDGRSTVEDIIDGSGLPVADATAILQELLARGAIALE